MKSEVLFTKLRLHRVKVYRGLPKFGHHLCRSYICRKCFAPNTLHVLLITTSRLSSLQSLFASVFPPLMLVQSLESKQHCPFRSSITQHLPYVVGIRHYCDFRNWTFKYAVVHDVPSSKQNTPGVRHQCHRKEALVLLDK